jgi:hypothetical protein
MVAVDLGQQGRRQMQNQVDTVLPDAAATLERLDVARAIGEAKVGVLRRARTDDSWGDHTPVRVPAITLSTILSLSGSADFAEFARARWRAFTLPAPLANTP